MPDFSSPILPRFVLDQYRAKEWLEHAVQVAQATADGAQTPPWSGSSPQPREALPEIDEKWDPRNPECCAVEARDVVMGAVGAGILAPAPGNHATREWDIDFVYREVCVDPAAYFFVVKLGERLKLSSPIEDVKYLGRDTLGADAAMGLLEEAVNSANAEIDALEEFVRACTS